MPLCMPLPLARCPKQATRHRQAGSSKSTSVPLPRRSPKCPRPQVRRSSAAACLPAAWWPVIALVAALVIPTEVLVVVVGPSFAPWRRDVPASTPAAPRALAVSPTCPEVQHSRLGVLACRIRICPLDPAASLSAAVPCSSASARVTGAVVMNQDGTSWHLHRLSGPQGRSARQLRGRGIYVRAFRLLAFGTAMCFVSSVL